MMPLFLLVLGIFQVMQIGYFSLQSRDYFIAGLVIIGLEALVLAWLGRYREVKRQQDVIEIAMLEQGLDPMATIGGGESAGARQESEAIAEGGLLNFSREGEAREGKDKGEEKGSDQQSIQLITERNEEEEEAPDEEKKELETKRNGGVGVTLKTQFKLIVNKDLLKAMLLKKQRTTLLKMGKERFQWLKRLFEENVMESRKLAKTSHP